MGREICTKGPMNRRVIRRLPLCDSPSQGVSLLDRFCKKVLNVRMETNTQIRETMPDNLDKFGDSFFKRFELRPGPRPL